MHWTEKLPVKPPPAILRSMKAWPLIALALVFTAHHSARACSCIPPPPPLEALEQADAVFSGTVISIVSDGSQMSRNDIVSFQVEKVWKGVTSRTVQLTTASTGAACGYGFREGTAYLVYAHGTPDLSVNSCSRTKLLVNAQEDLFALNSSTFPPLLRLILRWILTVLCFLGFDVCDLILYL